MINDVAITVLLSYINGNAHDVINKQKKIYSKQKIITMLTHTALKF